MNGWTNEATWFIYKWLLKDRDLFYRMRQWTLDGDFDHEFEREKYLRDLVIHHSGILVEGLAGQLAYAAIQDVDWHQILNLCRNYSFKENES